MIVVGHVEVIAEAALCMRMEGTVEDLADADGLGGVHDVAELRDPGAGGDGSSTAEIKGDGVVPAPVEAGAGQQEGSVRI